MNLVKVFVSKHAYLKEREWLRVGWKLWEQLGFEASLERRDFPLPLPSPDLQHVVRRMASYAPASLNKVEYQDIRKRFERMYYKLEDRTTPSSATLVELICDQVESGELKPLHLVQCLSQEDAEIDPVGAVIDKSGSLKIKKGYGETTEPGDPEEYRRRMKIVAHVYIFAHLKYPHKAILKDLTPYTFQRFVDFVLGEHVLGLEAKDDAGLVVSKPTFKSVLHYEHQVRKEMIRLTNEGHKMGDALEAARKDTVIKERHFITPTSLAALVVAQKRDDRSRSPRGGQQGGGWHGRDWHGDWHRGKHGGYGKGKGSKGKQSGKKGNLHNKTPDGREICWKWNSQHERCRFNCGRVHQCQICLASHPMHACPHGKQKGPPTSRDKWQRKFRRAPYFAFLRKKPGGDSKGGWQWQPWVQCLRSWARRR